MIYFSSTNDDPFGEDVEEEERNGMRETVLHLYIPDHTSPLLMLIQSAWNSCIIVSSFSSGETYLWRVEFSGGVSVL